jgi:hypothetical protein
LPFLTIFASEYAVWKVQDKQEGLELKGTHPLLVCSDDLNMLGENTNAIKKNIEAPSAPSKEIDSEVYT